MMTYRVYLYKTPRTVRGWLAYVRPHPYSGEATVTVLIDAKSAADAKNKAITQANKGFVGTMVVGKNMNKDDFWGLPNFPEVTFPDITTLGAEK